MYRRAFIGVPAVVAICAAGCGSPIAPADPNGQTVHVTGRVIAYAGSTSSPISANLFGWVDAADGGRPTGRIALDEQARFDLEVERGARVRLYAGGDTGNETYQPCAVTVVANTHVQRDVRVVTDYALIGAAVPPLFLEGTRTLSGVVFETFPGGGRRPVPFATVSIGGLRAQGHDLGWPIANTRTDSAGRYVLCGLETDPIASLYVINPIHEMFESVVHLSGDTVLDIELTRTGLLH